MKFKKALPDESVSSEDSKTIKDPKKYPKELWAHDTGVSDRGVTGFTSDVNVLKHKEKTGVRQ